jgi:polygalacturonase
VIPEGSGSYFSGPLTLASNINLQVNGELQMLSYGTYPANSNDTASTNFISATKLTNVEIRGSVTIDGQGSAS